jgi:hypothetical protein
MTVRSGIDERRICEGRVPDREASGYSARLWAARYRSIVAADMARNSPNTAGVALGFTFPSSLKRVSRSKVSSMTAARYFPHGCPASRHTSCSTTNAS